MTLDKLHNRIKKAQKGCFTGPSVRDSSRDKNPKMAYLFPFLNWAIFGDCDYLVIRKSRLKMAQFSFSTAEMGDHCLSKRSFWLDVSMYFRSRIKLVFMRAFFGIDLVEVRSVIFKMETNKLRRRKTNQKRVSFHARVSRKCEMIKENRKSKKLERKSKPGTTDWHTFFGQRSADD